MPPAFYDMKRIALDTGALKNLDYLFLAGGVDNRAYEILNRFSAKKFPIEKVVVFDFKERKDGLDKNPTHFDAYYIYKKHDYSIVEIPSSLHDPSECLRKLDYYGIKISGKKSIGIDISCFTKPFFFLFLKLLHVKYQSKSLQVFYTEPKSYLFTKGLYNAYRSSSGPLKVIELPGYAGHTPKTNKRLLVILLGVDGDLSREINEDVAPEETIVVNGFPGYEPKFKDISLICNEKLISNPRNKLRYSRANNPFELYNLLDSLRKEYGDAYFINIAPLGTKPMALGACLFAIHNPNVRVIYPMPQNYEKITTDNCYHSWSYSVALAE